ncbi:MAG TPA: oligosaccharide flippase family protein, partial [Chitinophagaceae bacterium]|nr:oligosaccharide flippase family protein [Chitinophagaceae bacterium]
NSGSLKAIVTLISRIITAVIGIIFVPIYVRIIGVESYGLVAFYGTLAGSLAILDLGLSTAINRQVAILKAHTNKEKEIKDLIFSVELIYWSIGLLVGLLIVVLAHPIAIYWVKAKDLPTIVIERAVMLMGAVFAFQFPTSIYNGVMIGMERQVPNAVLTILFTVARAAGVILILKLVQPTVEYYFLWQVLLTFLFTISLRIYVRQKLTIRNTKARFSVPQLKSIWRFAAGMAGISVVTFFLSQVDKIVVSKLVLLEFVGYYSLAFLIANVLQQVISPLQVVVFPRFASLLAQNKQSELLELYHRSCRWVAIIVFPIGLVLIFFAKEILMFWTKNPELVKNTAPLVQVCTAGTVCNCMMWIPYSYLLAKGNTRFTIYQNIIASVILVPLLFWWTGKYGAIGACFVWLSINIGYVLISLPLFYHRYLKGEMGRWYKKDVALPLITAMILTVGAKYFQVRMIPDIKIIYFIILLLFISSIYFFIIPELRAFSSKLKFGRRSRAGL